MPSAKVTGKPTKAKPVAVVDIDIKKADVGDLAHAAADAKTPHRGDGAPSATLILEASGLTKANAEKVDDALAKVKGVDAKASKADLKEKEIHVKLDDKGGAKLADIKKALADYLK